MEKLGIIGLGKLEATPIDHTKFMISRNDIPSFSSVNFTLIFESF